MSVDKFIESIVFLYKERGASIIEISSKIDVYLKSNIVSVVDEDNIWGMYSLLAKDHRTSNLRGGL